jgi:hypothetical protein
LRAEIAEHSANITCQNHPRSVGITLSGIKYLAGRGSRIRTCDLEYPKLPRYQAALYPARALGVRSTDADDADAEKDAVASTCFRR